MPEMQKTWVPSLGRGDPLEEGMAIYSSVLAWRIPWKEILPPGSHQAPFQDILKALNDISIQKTQQNYYDYLIRYNLRVLVTYL